MENMMGISQRYNRIVALVNDETIPQEDINAALIAVMDDVKTKGENGINYLNSLDDNIEAATKRKKHLDEYIKALKNRKKRVLAAYMAAMNNMGMKSIMTGAGELKIRKNPCSVVIDDPDQVPDAFKVQSITITPNKTAIKEALKNDETVPGCHLEQSLGLKY